jgi:hypothetical protein
MTPTQRNTLSTAVLATLLGSVALAILTGAWSSKVDRSEYTLHVQTKQAELHEVREIVLDLLCAQQPTHRRCKP